MRGRGPGGGGGHGGPAGGPPPGGGGAPPPAPPAPPAATEPHWNDWYDRLIQASDAIAGFHYVPDRIRDIDDDETRAVTTLGWIERELNIEAGEITWENFIPRCREVFRQLGRWEPHRQHPARPEPEHHEGPGSPAHEHHEEQGWFQRNIWGPFWTGKQ